MVVVVEYEMEVSREAEGRYVVDIYPGWASAEGEAYFTGVKELCGVG